MKSRKQLFAAALVVGLMSFVNCGNAVFASQVSNTKVIPVESLTYQNNGGEVQLKKSKKDEMWVEFDTTGERKGYYTTYFYAEQREMIEDGAVISIHIKTKQKVRMNTDVVLSPEYGTYTVEDGARVFLKSDDSEQYEVGFIEYGTLEVPENFEGNIYFPISTEKASLKTYGIGFIVVLSEDELAEFTIGKIETRSGFAFQEEIYQVSFEVVGESYPEIPMYGEYYYSYSLEFLDKKKRDFPIRFYLESPIEGITIEPSGKLTVHSGVKTQTVSIGIEVDGALLYHYKVEVTESWLAKVENVDVSSFIVPDVKDVKQVGSEVEIPYRFLRVLGIGISGGFAMFYFLKIRRKG